MQQIRMNKQHWFLNQDRFTVATVTDAPDTAKLVNFQYTDGLQ